MTVNVNQILINQTWQAFLDRFNVVASHMSTTVVTLGSNKALNSGNIAITGDFSGQAGNFTQTVKTDNELVANNHIRARNAVVSDSITSSALTANNVVINNDLTVANNIIGTSCSVDFDYGKFNDLVVSNKIANLKVAALEVDAITLPQVNLTNITVSGTATITDITGTVANIGTLAAGSISMGGVALGEMAKRNKIAPADLEISSLVQVPIGAMIQFAGNSLPSGYIPLNGTTHPKANFPLLWDWIVNFSSNVDYNATSPLGNPNPVTKHAANTTHFKVANMGGIAPFNLPSIRLGLKAA